MRNVLVFATSIDSLIAVRTLTHALNTLCGVSGWNVDLDDCDRILRVTAEVTPGEVMDILKAHGFTGEELRDEVPQPEFWRQLQVS